MPSFCCINRIVGQLRSFNVFLIRKLKLQPRACANDLSPAQPVLKAFLDQKFNRFRQILIGGEKRRGIAVLRQLLLDLAAAGLDPFRLR